MKHLVKRHGHKELYDARKLYASVYAASLNAHHDKERAEKMATIVSDMVTDWIAEQKDFSSNALFKQATEELRKLDKDAAFMYETHRDIS